MAAGAPPASPDCFERSKSESMICPDWWRRISKIAVEMRVSALCLAKKRRARTTHSQVSDPDKYTHSNEDILTLLSLPPHKTWHVPPTNTSLASSAAHGRIHRPYSNRERKRGNLAIGTSGTR